MRFVKRLAFKVLAFEVESVELMRERLGLEGIVRGEELDTERRRADAPTCIDAWPQGEPEMIGLGEVCDGGDVHKGAQAKVASLSEEFKAAADECAIEALKWHDVTDCAKCNEVAKRHEIGERGAGKGGGVCGLTEVPLELNKEEENEAGSTKRLTEGDGRLVEPEGVNDSCGGGKLEAGDVMVEDDGINTELLSAGDLGEGKRSAVDHDEELRAFLGKGFDGGEVNAIAFGEAIGDVEVDGEAERFEVEKEERG